MTEKIKIYDLNLDLPDLEKKAVCLGYFDGVHLGHMKLMDKNIEISKKHGLTPSILLFKEGKKSVKDDKSFLSSLEDKIEILSEKGIKTFCLIDFDESFMSLSPHDFIKKIIAEKLNAKAVIVGEDYSFGYKARGDISILKKYESSYGYKTFIVDFEMENDVDKISSNHLRDLIRNGKISYANSYLGRPYKVRGEVVDGEKRGRLLNFPTANLKMSFSYVLPKDGVYLTRTKLSDRLLYSLTNVGSNPTFKDSQEKKIETYIYDFNENIYGEKISVEFLKFFRPDFKFDSAESLIRQMDKDKARGREEIKKLEK